MNSILKPARNPRRGPVISEKWDERRASLGGPDEPPGPPIVPGEDQDAMLQSLASQTVQPYRPGWAALPGVAASLVGGMASQKLRTNQDARQADRAAKFDTLLQDASGFGVSDGQLAIAKAAGPEAGLRLLSSAIPQPGEQLDNDLKRARIAELKKKTTAGPVYGKDGDTFKGADGRFYGVQYSDIGPPKVVPLEAGGQPLTPSKGVKREGDILIDKATGNEVRSMAENIAGEEKAKIEGRTAGERQANKPKLAAAMQSAKRSWATVDATIEKLLPRVSDETAGLIGTVSALIPGTAAYDMQRDLETIQANIGFDKLADMRAQSPTGGALGNVSEFENRLLQAVQGALAPGQSAEQLRRNLMEVRKNLALLQQDREAAFKATYPDEDQASTPGAAPGAAVPSASSAPITKTAYDALPSGATYVAPDGKTRVKP